jgi:carbamate kinase
MGPTSRAGGPRVVVAFGGNALSPHGNESEAFQAQLARRAVGAVLSAFGAHAGLVLVHGNGPQVGASLLRDQTASERVPRLSLAGHVAGTQGSMGYLLELGLRNSLAEAGVEREVAAVLSIVEVDPRDPALVEPAKPVGPYYRVEEVERLREDHGWKMVEDSGRGWRRVVASPRPLSLLNAGLVRHLVEDGVVVVAGGGGGIAVVPVRGDGAAQVPDALRARHLGSLTGSAASPRARADREWRSFDAVIDKDRTATLVAKAVDADLWVCLTDVEYVFADFGTKRQRPLERLSASEAEELLEAGQFPSGSMGPKVEAAVDFVRACGGEAVITSIDGLAGIGSGRAGTRIVSGEPSAR